MPEEQAVEACRQESRKTAWPYEPDVFRERFVSPFEQYADRIGQQFTVIKAYTMAETAAMCGVEEDEAQEMYRIRFADGTEIVAWGEEVCVETPEEGRPT